MAELKAFESNAGSKSESKPDKGTNKGKKIIDVEPGATVATIKIQKIEPEDLQEGERIFHSQKWVKGSLLQLIFHSMIQKNPISIEVMKHLGLKYTT